MTTGKRVLSFGGYCEYYLTSLLERRARYEEHGLCIDMGGLNHMGHPNVVLSGEEMQKIFKQIDEV
jgi:hypothetical protein